MNAVYECFVLEQSFIGHVKLFKDVMIYQLDDNIHAWKKHYDGINEQSIIYQNLN